MIRLWLDTGLRRSELAHAVGKGRKPRTVAFGRATATALARYVRVRGRHPPADLPARWLGDRGRGPSRRHERVSEMWRHNVDRPERLVIVLLADDR